MTNCEKCSQDYEETEMVLVQEEKIRFMCRECYQLTKKNEKKVKPLPIKP